MKKTLKDFLPEIKPTRLVTHTGHTDLQAFRDARTERMAVIQAAVAMAPIRDYDEAIKR